MKKVKKIFLSIFMTICMLSSFVACGKNTETESSSTADYTDKATTSKVSQYWPDKKWRTSSPQEQGMSSEKLLEMINLIQKQQIDIHSIVIIRNGYKVLDASFFPYKSDLKHSIFSCTKGVTSTLMGIATEEGDIKDINQKVVDFFPEYTIENLDEAKKNLTLSHLLTMTTGLEWKENGSYDGTDSWVQTRWSGNYVQYILNNPMSQDPGTSFYYNSGASHLLSAVLQKSTGQNTYDYATRKLFEPLGIKEVFWESDPQGVNIGGTNLFMSAQDMARFGYLYLRNGCWNGKQLVSESWIKEATTKHVDTPNAIAGRDGYGYQWWMNSFGGYSARGYGGQYIFVIPEEDLVVVFTSSLQGSDFFVPESLTKNYILTAVNSTQSLEDDQVVSNQLQSKLEEIQNPPKSSEIPPFPLLAKGVSGKKLELENGEVLELDFSENGNGPSVSFRHRMSNSIAIGLDDVYQISDAGNYWPLPDHNMVATKGQWKDDKTFVINLLSLHEIDKIIYTISFEGSTVDVRMSSLQSGEIMHSKGQMK